MKKQKETEEKGERKNTLKSKILFLIQKRNDVTRKKLVELLEVHHISVDNALVSLRKAGIKIWPSKGHGTPLKIASTQLDLVKYMNWRRRLYLPTMKRMIAVEHESGEKFAELSSRSSELVRELEAPTKEHGI